MVATRGNKKGKQPSKSQSKPQPQSAKKIEPPVSKERSARKPATPKKEEVTNRGKYTKSLTKPKDKASKKEEKVGKNKKEEKKVERGKKPLSKSREKSAKKVNEDKVVPKVVNEQPQRGRSLNQKKNKTKKNQEPEPSPGVLPVIPKQSKLKADAKKASKNQTPSKLTPKVTKAIVVKPTNNASKSVPKSVSKSIPKNVLKKKQPKAKQPSPKIEKKGKTTISLAETLKKQTKPADSKKKGKPQNAYRIQSELESESELSQKLKQVIIQQKPKKNVEKKNKRIVPVPVNIPSSSSSSDEESAAGIIDQTLPRQTIPAAQPVQQPMQVEDQPQVHSDPAPVDTKKDQLLNQIPPPRSQNDSADDQEIESEQPKPVNLSLYPNPPNSPIRVPNTTVPDFTFTNSFPIGADEKEDEVLSEPNPQVQMEVEQNSDEGDEKDGYENEREEPQAPPVSSSDAQEPEEHRELERAPDAAEVEAIQHQYKEDIVD